MNKACLLSGLLLSGCVARAAQISFPITADTYVDSRSSNTGKNYGSAITVKVLVNSSDGSVCRGLFQLPSELSAYARQAARYHQFARGNLGPPPPPPSSGAPGLPSSAAGRWA